MENILGILGLVLAIISCFLTLIFIYFISLPLGIAALVISIIGKVKEQKPTIIGIIFSIIAIFGSIMIIVFLSLGILIIS